MMDEMTTLQKAKIHIENFARSKSPRFMLYSVLAILNRKIPLPAMILNSVGMGGERHLEKYMLPRNNGCFVDVGAYKGFWSLFVAKRGKKVHAFEPNPRMYKFLKSQGNRYSNLRVYPYALGEAKYVAKLNLHLQSAHDSLVKKGKDFSGVQIPVSVRTLDSLRLENVGLIKIDTEGYEFPILLGAENTILSYKPRLIIEIHKPYREQIEKIEKLLSSWNYTWIVRYKSAKIDPQPHIIADPRETK